MKHTFKTICSIATMSAMLIMAASCAKEDLAEEAQKYVPSVERQIYVKASLPPDENNDKAYLSTTTRKVMWEMGDQININGSLLQAYDVDNNATKPTAKFNGIAHAFTSGTNEVYWAVYPKNLVGEYTSSIPSEFALNGLTYTLPTTQKIVCNNTSADVMQDITYMAAYTEVPEGKTNLSFDMHNLGSVMHLVLSAAAGQTNTRVKRLEFTTTDGALAGDFTLATDATTITASASAAKILTVNLSDGANNYVDIANSTDIYVILPPMDNKQLTIKIYNDEGGLAQRSSTSVVMERSKIHTTTIDNINFDDTDPYFSVSDNNKVLFAYGNLQWSAKNGGSTATTHNVADGTTKAGTWRFAEHQWDALLYENNKISATYSGWIDLFGWGTSGYNDETPYKTNNNDSKYLGHSLTGDYKYYDWGIYNEIYNPTSQTTDAPGTWRTLTVNEWSYVLFTRATKSGAKSSSTAKRYAKATVNGVYGLILLPDNWNTSTYSLSKYDTKGAAYSTNIISAEQWSTLENAGAIFLPATRYRDGTTIASASSAYDANYWSTTYDAQHPGFDNGDVYINDGCHRRYGHAVRLARDVQY